MTTPRGPFGHPRLTETERTARIARAVANLRADVHARGGHMADCAPDCGTAASPVMSPFTRRALANRLPAKETTR